MNNILGKLRHLMNVKKADSSLRYAKTYSYPGQLRLSALRPLSERDLFTAGETLFEKEVWQDESLPFNIELAIVRTTLTITVTSRSADHDNCFAQIQLFELGQTPYEVVIMIMNGSGSYQTHVNEVPRPRSQPFNMNVRAVKTFDLVIES